ncbi:hypothetical protein MATL_G00102680 [Megalops atlanticus]|uniref:Uncharacterized protein n=1 Tax=Megalops atlanticus TaxID=7932 RepID=A0A9D3Q3B7_MEGAT|nr:hypothetical protein MATL_G00102680 [Megalops atlanticus]
MSRMKALQKNQGRTDQILGAMADMLTSLALPKQQWVSETSEEHLLVGKEGQSAEQVDWGARRPDVEQGFADDLESRVRAEEDSTVLVLLTCMVSLSLTN